ncbi:unnamed protein product [Taenia asiatica]|uniref:Peptidase M1 membrane alanine aminopeptidase domain-containing protein n=1 Tax=Taenia asiatica TaxID=60517 RepID=A0A3P6PFR0_TAEAS|nr:unnamed protein product [Taenia asiatica]
MKYTEALLLDELKSSHPIEVEVNNAQEVEEILDAVSYQKGSCVIRMLHDYMGASVSLFQAGLKVYFEKFKYSNARTEDLWAALETTGIVPMDEADRLSRVLCSSHSHTRRKLQHWC